MKRRQRLPGRLLARLMIVALVGGSVVVMTGPTLAASQTITGANTFASLDNSGIDEDATVGVFYVSGDLILDNGATITCNDPASPSGASACNMVINVGGDLVLRANSKITADNTAGGGSGGNITITVVGDMTMCAAAGAQTGCNGASAGPGAIISARKLSGAGDTGHGGNITITVGDINNATGNFYMEGGSTGYGTETGAKILASGTGPAGDITITAGRTYFTEPGAVVEAGGPAATASTIEQGGKIYIVVGCNLTTEGRITSKGHDPGADLVHLEGCDVFVRGLVESTGKGHTVAANPNQNNVAPANNCDGYDDGTADSIVRAGKPGNATACIEVWGGNLVIDSTNGWAGELNADIGNGGASGSSWIDIYAFASLLVHDGAGNNKVRDNGSGHDYLSTYAVHANTMDGSDNTPNTITAMVDSGPLTADPNAFESSATLTAATGHSPGPYFTGNGSTGGTIDLESSGNLDLNDVWVNASGDFVGNSPPCDSGSGTCGSGGHIIGSAWDTGSDLTWQGDGDVSPNLSGPNGANGTTTAGDINLNACDVLTTAGADFHGATVPPNPNNCSATKPDIPAYVVFNFDVWANCRQTTTTTSTTTTTTTTTETSTTVSESTTTTTTTTESTTTTTTTESTTTTTTETTTTTTTPTTTTTTTTTETVPDTTTTTTTTTTTETVPETTTTTTTTTETTSTVPESTTTTTASTSTAHAPTPTPFNGAESGTPWTPPSNGGTTYLTLAMLFGAAGLIVFAIAPWRRRRPE